MSVLRRSLFIRILMIRLIILLIKLIVLLSYIHLFLASPLGPSDISPLSFIQLIFPFPKSYKAVSRPVTKLSVRVSLFMVIFYSSISYIFLCATALSVTHSITVYVVLTPFIFCLIAQITKVFAKCPI